MDFNSYNLDRAVFDEMFGADGTPREGSRPLYEALTQLSQEELGGIQETGDALVLDGGHHLHGVRGRGGGGADHPRRLRAAHHHGVRVGLSGAGAGAADHDAEPLPERRVRRGAHRAGRRDPRGRGARGARNTAWRCGGWSRRWACGWPSAARTSCGTNDGFFVLEDNLRVPSGVSYMIANRKAVKAGLRRVYRSSHVRDVEHYGLLLREDAAGTGATRARRPLGGAADAGDLQLGVLRAHVSGGGVGGAAGRGAGPGGQRRVRVHADDVGAAARRRDLPASGRRLPGPRWCSGRTRCWGRRG